MSTPDFEERLLTQLKNVVAARAATPSAARPVSTRRLVLALGAAIALSVAGGAVLFSLRSTPAYAVERDPDGSIRVYIRDYRDPKGLQARIESFGVPAAVDYIPRGTACREPRGDFVPRDQVPRAMVDWGPFGDESDRYWKLYPQYIRPGQTFVYTVEVARGYQRAMVRLANGPVAPCVQVPAG
jgi:hypothetical protein